MKRILIAVVMLVCSAAFADEFRISSAMTQSQFQSLTKEIGLLVTPTPNSPAEPLKTIGFDIAVEAVAVDIKNEQDYWINAWDDADPDSVLMATRVHVQKGFPMGLDLGASVTKGTNIQFTAVTGEVKYAILEGTTVTPALSVKASVTRVFGLEDINMTTMAAGAYISKGILFLTPYAGVESVLTMASDDSDNDLDSENTNTVRALAGLQISPLPLISLNIEAATGSVTQIGLKAGIRF
jgi:hypothetical protein